MIITYGTFNNDEHPAHFRFNRLKIDQVSSIYVGTNYLVDDRPGTGIRQEQNNRK